MKIAGLDIGTTGCKCTVFDENGRYVDNAHTEYHVKRQAWHEIDMEALKDSAISVILAMAHKYDDIAGIGVTSFGETFVLTDEDGRALHTAMLYTDPRGHGECRELIDKIGEERLARITGLRPHEMYGISKMMWIRNNMPDVYEKAKHTFQVEDYIVYALTGTAQIDYSLATRSMAFDITALDWSDEILNAAGIDRRLYPKPVPSGTSAGKITRKMSEITGLGPDTAVVSVSQDQIAAAVGAGAFDSSVAVDGAGTVECLTPIYDEMPDPGSMFRGYYTTVPYVVPGKYVTYAFSYTGCALTQWCTETIAKKEKEAASGMNISVNEYLEDEYKKKMESIGRLPDEPSGMLVLPHFAGAATPYMDTGSKGAIIGLTVDTSAAEIYHACLEGVCYEMYLNYSMLKDTGVKFNRINATGGGAHSAVWMQMKADMLGIPITALKTVDAGTVGSAMLTGVAIGHFAGLKEAASVMVEETMTYEPGKQQHEKYMEIYPRYEKLYRSVRPLV
ncbi:MAG: carbohydrate kinase [Lachnospiraceae bacterium]|nr:carbohydrate kinase [Lachnospiraceae bacterium]